MLMDVIKRRDHLMVILEIGCNVKGKVAVLFLPDGPQDF